MVATPKERSPPSGAIKGRCHDCLNLHDKHEHTETSSREHNASSMHEIAPEPPGEGAVMWWASALDAAPVITA